MSDAPIPAAPALSRRAWGWPVVALGNLVLGLAAVVPLAYALTWLDRALTGVAAYSSDPGFTDALGQVGLAWVLVSFVGGNLWLQWAVAGRGLREWLVALAAFAVAPGWVVVLPGVQRAL